MEQTKAKENLKTGLFVFDTVVLSCVAIFIIVVALIAQGKLVQVPQEVAVFSFGGEGQQESSTFQNVDATALTDIATVEIPGLSDLLLQEKQGIVLSNPEKNTYYLHYEISNPETGAIIYESGAIASGEDIIWVPSDYFETGEHSAVVRVYISETSATEKILKANTQCIIKIK